MYLFAHLIKDSIPSYLGNLPVPDSFGGWFRLSFKDWLYLIPPMAATAGMSYVSYRAFLVLRDEFRVRDHINPMIEKDCPKVVDTLYVEDITERVKLCRCWRSKEWPYCDGAHTPYNKQMGDNTGPYVVDVKPKTN